MMHDPINIRFTVYTVSFFSSKCSLFHNSNLFGSCFIHILYTRCSKIKKKNNSGAERLKKPYAYKKAVSNYIYIYVANNSSADQDISRTLKKLIVKFYVYS